MSWDLLLMAAPPGVRMEDTKEEHLRLGTRDEVVAAVRAGERQRLAGWGGGEVGLVRRSVAL